MDVILRYKDHSERVQFAVTGLGKQDAILGYTWLKDHNPEVDWITKEVKMSRCPEVAAVLAGQRSNRNVTNADGSPFHLRFCRTGSMPTVEEIFEDPPKSEYSDDYCEDDLGWNAEQASDKTSDRSDGMSDGSTRLTWGSDLYDHSP